MDEWEEYAELLAEIEDLHFELLDKLSGDVPKTVYHRGFDQMHEGEGILKSELENRMAKEHPDDWSTEVFYGND